MRKFHVNGVAVGVIAQRVQYYDADGKLILYESFKDYTRKTLLKEYASLDDFTRKWQDARSQERSDHSRAGATGDHLGSTGRRSR